MRIIFHVDVNAAFLSWTAAYRCQMLGEQQDLRDIPAAIAGEKANRHGIILAKSLPAKRMGVKTGEPIFAAVKKCPQLVTVPPDYALYTQASRRFIALLRSFTPLVEQYSIDEAWTAARSWQPGRSSSRFGSSWALPSTSASPATSCWPRSPGILKSQTGFTRYSRRRSRKSSGPCRYGSCFSSAGRRRKSCATSASAPSARWPRATRRCCSAICTSPAFAFGTTPMAAATTRCCRNSRKTRAMATPRPCLPM